MFLCILCGSIMLSMVFWWGLSVVSRLLVVVLVVSVWCTRLVRLVGCMWVL